MSNCWNCFRLSCTSRWQLLSRQAKVQAPRNRQGARAIAYFSDPQNMCSSYRYFHASPQFYSRFKTMNGVEEKQSGIPEKSVKEERTKKWKDAKTQHEKMKTSDPQHPVFMFGPMKHFHLGLGEVLGHPQKLLFEAMEREHCEANDSNDEFTSHIYDVRTTSRLEWHFVTNPSKENLERLEIDEWPKEKPGFPHPRLPKCLDSLEDCLKEYNTKLAKIEVPELTLIEVIACRLHTGPMGQKFNEILRHYGDRNVEHLKAPCKGNTYTTTIHVLQSAIAKLGKINPNRFAYSGIGALLLPDSIFSTKGGVLSGLMSLTQNVEVARQYARREGEKSGIVFKVDMATMDRGADTTDISQYPHEEETLLPPLTHLDIEHIELDLANDATQKPVWIVEARSRISQSIKVETPLLEEEEKTTIRNSSMPPNPAQKATTDLISRFTGGEDYLIIGDPMKSVRGLPYFLGVEEKKLREAMRPMSEDEDFLRGMREEIMKSSNNVVIENMKYVFDQEAEEKQMPNGFIRDKGNTGRKLEYFANLKAATGLTIAHVAALRLYTTPAFEYINKPLRNPNEDNGEKKNMAPHPFPVTVTFIDEGLKRLRGSNTEPNKYPTFWRGFKNIRIPEDFMENKRGGTELGLMSTTDNLSVAVAYSKSYQGSSLLFKIQVENVKQFGADISWLSTISSEREILYPPLTFLQPTGRVQTVTINGLFFTVIEVQPHI